MRRRTERHATASSVAVIAAIVLVGAEAWANPRPLPFTYQSETLPAGSAEIEQFVDFSPLRVFSQTSGDVPVWYLGTQFTTEFEIGLTDRLELGLLLIAQGCVEIVKHRAHQLDRLQHGVEPFADGREPCRWRDCIAGLAGGLEHLRRLGVCVLQRGKTRALGVGRVQPCVNLLGRPLQRRRLSDVAVLGK